MGVNHSVGRELYLDAPVSHTERCGVVPIHAVVVVSGGPCICSRASATACHPRQRLGLVPLQQLAVCV